VLEDSSPRNTLKKVGHRVGLACGVFALTSGLAMTPAQAASLSTLQQQAAAASAQAAAAKASAEAAAQQVADAQAQANAMAGRVSAAASQVAGSAQQAQDAGVVLTASEKKLADAQLKLYATQQRLQQARDYDAELASDLAAAQDALAAARAAVVAGQAQVDSQRLLMGSSAREEFQQQTPLEGLAAMFGAQSPADLSQRIQWTDTVFDTQTAAKARLDTALLQLQASRDLQSQIEARIAAAKSAAAAQVEIVADLTKQAKAQEADVAALVAANQQALLAAQKKLDADKNALGSAQGAQSAASQALTAAQGDLSDSQDSYQKALAEAKDLADAVKAEAARQAAAAAASGSSSSGSSSASTPRGDVSSDGFIRPIDASPGSPFGMRFHPILHIWRMHEGVDFGASCGTPIYAAKSGTVIMARMTLYSGNYTVISHGTVNGVALTTTYSHQTSFAVRVGQQVSRGQVIGYVGSTGLSTECHLHFEVRHDGTAVNPMDYIP